jgi:chemotaxis protein MotB
MSETRPIIIIKKKGGHGGHHGGAWKVAYADFVTAMMALFIVLWLMNTNKKVQEAIGGYFKDPTGQSQKAAAASMPVPGGSVTVSKDDMPKLKEELQKTVRQVAHFDKLKDHVEMTVTADGLRIELTESEVGTFFESGSSVPSANGRELLVVLAKELGKLPNKISIEGHTDAKPFAGKGHYGNWELSADRANAARRFMQENGVSADQVVQIRGYADQQLRKPSNPEDASNRRISLIVQYLDSKEEAGESTPGTNSTSPSKQEAKD